MPLKKQYTFNCGRLFSLHKCSLQYVNISIYLTYEVKYSVQVFVCVCVCVFVLISSSQNVHTSLINDTACISVNVLKYATCVEIWLYFTHKFPLPKVFIFPLGREHASVSELEVGRFLKIMSYESRFVLPVSEMRNCESESDSFSIPFTIPLIPIPVLIPRNVPKMARIQTAGITFENVAICCP